MFKKKPLVIAFLLILTACTTQQKTWTENTRWREHLARALIKMFKAILIAKRYEPEPRTSDRMKVQRLFFD